MVRGSNPAKVQQWTERLTRFRESSLPVKQFCQSEGVSTASFYQWRRKLGPSHANAPHANALDNGVASGFRTVQLTGNPSAGSPVSNATLTVDLLGGVQIHVAAHQPTIQIVLRELLDADARQEGATI